MLQLQLLGSLDLRRPNGTPVREVLAQPRRLALLAFLALHARHGPQRRDTLLALFWPESDSGRARGALRNALHFLRQALGAEAIRARSPQELQLNAEVVECDVLAFESCLERGQPGRALELYRGHLLEGFFLSNAPGFEGWLEEERARLRRRAVEAAMLAEQAMTLGEFGVAAHNARRALSLSGGDERWVRHLMLALEQAGDRAAAVRAYQEFEARLALELGVEPSQETRALADTLRSREAVPAVAIAAPPPAVPPPREPQPPDAPPPAPLPPADTVATVVAAVARRRWRWRPPRPAAALLALLTAALGLGFWALRPAAPTPLAGRVAVLPFSYRGAAEYSYLGDGMASLLSASLDGTGELYTTDPRAVLSAASRSPAAPLAPREGAAMAARFGAAFYVLGDITEAGGRLRVSATLHRRGHGARSSAVAEGPVDSVFYVVDRVAFALLAERARPGMEQLAARTTGSLPALKAYLRGERELRGGRYLSATIAFHQATEADSSFALAQHRLSYTAIWTPLARLSLPAARAALRHSRRLGPQDSMRVRAWLLYLDGAPAAAAPLYRSILTLRPSDVEAWHQWGELLFHWGPMLGHPPATARAPFERVLLAEPLHAGALIHLARLAAHPPHSPRLDSLVERALGQGLEANWRLELRALQAFSRPDSAAQEQVARELRQAHGALAVTVLRRVAAHTQNLAGAERLATALLEESPADRPVAETRLLRALLLAAQGQALAAERELALLGLAAPARALEFRAALAQLLPPSGGRAALAAMRDSLAHIIPDLPLPTDDDPLVRGYGPYPPLEWEGIYPPRRVYLVGALSLLLGDTLAARGAAAALAAMQQPAFVRSDARAFAALLRARLLAHAGQRAAALAVLNTLPASRSDSLLPGPTHYPRADLHLLRADLLAQQGRSQQALRWYETFPDVSGFDIAYLAHATLRRAEIHRQLRQPRAARQEYERFLTLWARADSAQQPLLGHARRQVAGLPR